MAWVDGGAGPEMGKSVGVLDVGLADVEACRSRQHHPIPGGPFGDSSAVIPQEPRAHRRPPSSSSTPRPPPSPRASGGSQPQPVQATGPSCLHPHQLPGSAAFTVLPPLTLTWMRSGWPLGGIFRHLDPGLAFLTLYGGGQGLLLLDAPACLGAEPSRSRKGGFLGRGVLLPSSGPGHAGSTNSGRAR